MEAATSGQGVRRWDAARIVPPSHPFHPPALLNGVCVQDHITQPPAAHPTSPKRHSQPPPFPAFTCAEPQGPRRQGAQKIRCARCHRRIVPENAPPLPRQWPRRAPRQNGSRGLSPARAEQACALARQRSIEDRGRVTFSLPISSHHTGEYKTLSMRPSRVALPPCSCLMQHNTYFCGITNKDRVISLFDLALPISLPESTMASLWEHVRGTAPECDVPVSPNLLRRIGAWGSGGGGVGAAKRTRVRW